MDDETRQSPKYPPAGAERDYAPVDHGDVYDRSGAPTEEEALASPPLLNRYPATIGLMVLLTGIYALSSWPGFARPNDEFLMAGVFHPALFAAGEWWRLITANLLHADLAHLFNNLFGIFIFGQMLEPALGWRNMLGLYVTSGVLAMVFSFWFLDGATLGASGIDFGLIGAYITLILLMRRRTDPALFRQELRSAAIFFVIFVVWNAMEIQHVNLWGHLGGLVGGVGFALLLFGFGRR